MRIKWGWLESFGLCTLYWIVHQHDTRRRGLPGPSLVLMITLYLGLGMTAHQKPDVKRSRTTSMTTPDRIEDDDELTNVIDINDNLTSKNATQQNARAYPGGNQRKSEKKMRQLRQLLSTNEGPGTADEKRCTQHQNDIIYNEKEHPRTTPVTPTVVTQVETCECLEKASLLINSHGAAELPDDALHLRPWDVWIKQTSNQNNCTETSLQVKNVFDNTFPRDTPAIKAQALIAKWMVQRIVRNNQVVDSPRRFLR